MEVIFRNITNSDIDGCLDILKEKYSGEQYDFFRGVLLKDISSFLDKSSPVTFLVVEKNESIIGFGTFTPTNQNNVYQLIWINISKPEQGKGLGKQLIVELENKIKESNNDKFTIVLETDKPVFYEKLGYKTFNKKEGNDLMMKNINKGT